MARDESTDPVGPLAEEFVARHRRGERPALTEYAEKHPDLAERIRQIFPIMLMMEEAGHVSGDATTPPPVRPADQLQALAGFRMIREIGRGGMGVVYEAEELALGRRVALKILPPNAVGSATALERFRREAQAAARLHHTNIVPVFGVGECAGVHYYVMQFIDGQSLDAVLDEVRRIRAGQSPTVAEWPSAPVGAATGALLTGRFQLNDLPGSTTETPQDRPHPLTEPAQPNLGIHALTERASGVGKTRRQYPRSVAAIGVQVAEALAHAHKQGILHRDVKPSNLLLDARGTVWVADFGLAKAVDGAELTGPGDLAGTLRYMAPERFDGRADARSDLYGLGLTLYEMLALRPAFDATQQAELVQQVLGEEPPRLRGLDPSVPSDLETIVAKAIRRETTRRYQTAEELAADLQRFLEDRPIQARRTGPFERGWRWCRRQPARAGLLATAATSLLALSAGSLAVAIHVNRLNVDLQFARDQATLKASQAEGRRTEAEQARQLTREALDELFSTVVESWLGQQPVLTAEHKEFLARILAHYERFAQEGGDDPRQRLLLARAYSRVGRIRAWLGMNREAQETYRRGIELLDPLVPEHVGDLAAWHNAMGVLQAEQGLRAAAYSSLEAARDLSERLVRDHPNTPSYVERLARTHHDLGMLRWKGGQTEAALKSYEAALVLKQRLVDDHPAASEYAFTLASTHNSLGALHADMNRGSAALASFDAARALQERIVQDHPHVFRYARELGLTRYNLGNLRWDLGERDAARQALEEARALQVSLVRFYPGIPDWTRELSQTCNNLGLLQVELKQQPAARASFETARALDEKLVSRHPGTPQYAVSLGGTYCNLGLVSRDLDKSDEALHWFGLAIATLEPVWKTKPHLARAQTFLRNAHWERAGALNQRQRYAEALKDWDRAVELDTGNVLAIGVGRVLTLAQLGQIDKARAGADVLVPSKRTPPDVLRDLACTYALIAAAEVYGASQERNGARAVELLRQALHNGLTGEASLKNDPAFASLRPRRDFQALLAEVERGGPAKK